MYVLSIYLSIYLYLPEIILISLFSPHRPNLLQPSGQADKLQPLRPGDPADREGGRDRAVDRRQRTHARQAPRDQAAEAKDTVSSYKRSVQDHNFYPLSSGQRRNTRSTEPIKIFVSTNMILDLLSLQFSCMCCHLKKIFPILFE